MGAVTCLSCPIDSRGYPVPCSLDDYAYRHGDFSEEELWSMLADIASALEHIHGNGLLHLDIKPANMFLTGSPLADASSPGEAT